MYDTNTPPPVLLNAAGQSVREFNHASQDVRVGWGMPSDAYDAIGSLACLVRMLPQAIEQTMRPVERTHDEGRVTADGGDPKSAVAELRAATAEAAALAQALTAAVDRMHCAAAPLGLDIRGPFGLEDSDA